MSQNFRDSLYLMFLHLDHQIKINFHLSDNTVIDLDAMIVGIDGSEISLKSFRNHDRELSEVPKKTPVIIVSSETWAICRFNGTLGQTTGSSFTVHLHGQPEIKQRRDYFRFDVQIPIIYNSPDDQQLNSLEGAWKSRRLMYEHFEPCIKPYNGSFKVINWGNGIDIEPCIVNLSGGGLRINATETFKHGHLLELTLFLPAPSIRAIFVVATVIRSTEVTPVIDSLKSYSVAMKFVFISEKDQERIISHIFNDQPE